MIMESSKDLPHENQEDKDDDKKENDVVEKTECVASENNDCTNIDAAAEPKDEMKEELSMEATEDAIGEQQTSNSKCKLGPASKIGRAPYKAAKRKIGPASKMGRRQVGPRFLRKQPRLDIDKLSNSTRKCNFCDNICTQLSQMVNHTLSHFTEDISKELPTSEPFTCPTCSAEYKEKATLIRHLAFTHRNVLEHCKEEELKGRLVACESDAVVAPELPAVAKGRSASARKSKYKRTKSDDDFVDDQDSDYSQSSGSIVSSASSAEYEYNSGSGSKYSRSSGDSGSDSSGGDSVDYESASEDEQDSDEYNIKKPPRALGWESD